MRQKKKRSQRRSFRSCKAARSIFSTALAASFPPINESGDPPQKFSGRCRFAAPSFKRKHDTFLHETVSKDFRIFTPGSRGQSGNHCRIFTAFLLWPLIIQKAPPQVCRAGYHSSAAYGMLLRSCVAASKHFRRPHSNFAPLNGGSSPRCRSRRGRPRWFQSNCRVAPEDNAGGLDYTAD